MSAARCLWGNAVRLCLLRSDLSGAFYKRNVGHASANFYNTEARNRIPRLSRVKILIHLR